MESRGTGASEDGWRRSPRTILRRRRPTGWKRTREKVFGGGKGRNCCRKQLRVSCAEEGVKVRVL